MANVCALVVCVQVGGIMLCSLKIERIKIQHEIEFDAINRPLGYPSTQLTTCDIICFNMNVEWT